MDPIRCFLITPANRARLTLRRYHGDIEGEPKCPITNWIHNAEVLLGDFGERLQYDPRYETEIFQHDGPQNRSELSIDEESRWPVKCECGYRFVDTDAFQIFHSSLYRRDDSGEIIPLRDPPVGAMWWLRWMSHGLFTPQLGEYPLCVKTPGGEWIIDSQANNCTMKDDHNQAQHHCWVAHGMPPDVTVDKNGVTCQAGGGSILQKTFHGFLRGGYLVGA